MATKPSRSGHLPINSLSLYHEVYGDLGPSSVMLQKVPATRLVILPATLHVGIAGESAVLAPMVRTFSMM